MLRKQEDKNEKNKKKYNHQMGNLNWRIIQISNGHLKLQDLWNSLMRTLLLFESFFRNNKNVILFIFVAEIKIIPMNSTDRICTPSDEI